MAASEVINDLYLLHNFYAPGNCSLKLSYKTPNFLINWQPYQSWLDDQQ